MGLWDCVQVKPQGISQPSSLTPFALSETGDGIRLSDSLSVRYRTNTSIYEKYEHFLREHEGFSPYEGGQNKHRSANPIFQISLRKLLIASLTNSG